MSKSAFLLALFFIANLTYAQTGESETIILNSRGLIKSIYTEPHRQDPTGYSTWVKLKGTSDRAACTATVISEYDHHSLEVLKMALVLNKPVVLRFKTARDPASLEHCEIHSVELRP